MAGGIDTSNRKPRRLRGTPALKFINKVSLITLAFCGALGYFMYTRPSIGRLEAKYFSDEEIERANKEREERRFMLSNQFVGQKPSSEIRQVLRHRQKSNSQLQSSQISRFFSQSNARDTTQKTQNDVGIKSDDDETTDSSENIQKNCDNNDDPTKTKPSTEPEISMQTEKKKKKHSSHRSTKTVDSTSTIKSFFSNENNDSLSDFEIPNKVAKKVPKLLPSKTVKSARARRKQPDIRKALSKKDAATEDYSHLPEDAQIELALAMSKAETAKGPSNASNQPIDLGCFEFRSENAKMNADFLEFFNMKQKAKGRFKWNSKCTQLTRRKDDVQKEKIRERIDEILLNNIIVESNQFKLTSSPELITTSDYTPYEIHSRRLQRICIAERILFELNACDENTGCNISSYYTNNLVDPSEFKAGVLLKDWATIPGRDSIYDGIHDTEGAKDKTDTAVISSSPVYDPTDNEQTDEPTDEPTDEQDKCDGESQNGPEGQVESVGIELADDRLQVETAGCSEGIHQLACSPMQVEDENETENEDDGDATVVMDSDDIQLKIDAINSKIRLSQNFSDIFQAPVVTYETTTRAISPDLFDDDDDIDMTEEIQTKPDIKSPVINEDEDTVEANSNDIVLISSEECNSEPASSKCTQHKSQESNTDHTLPNPIDAVAEVIELLDSDSEPMLKEPTESPIINNSEGNEGNTPFGPHVLVDYNWDDDYDNYMMQDMNQPNGELHEVPNQSTNLNEFASPSEKLSITERLELIDKAVENEFKDAIPAEHLSQPQQQLSQESIVLSDDDINYSMRKSFAGGKDHSIKLNKTASPVKKLSFTERLELFEKDMLNGFTGKISAEYLNQSQSQLSQESIELSDDEINYSMRKGVHVIDDDNLDMKYIEDERFNMPSPIEFDFRDTDSNSNFESDEKLVNQSICNIFEKTFEQTGSPVSSVTKRKTKRAKSLKKVNSETILSSRYANATPSTSGINTNRTPDKNSKLPNFVSPSKPNKSPYSQPATETRMDLSNDDYHIRFGSISPKPNYEAMDASILEMELRKFGLKPSLRRRQAIICLEYIYNRTHPFMESANDLEKSPIFDRAKDLEDITENNNQNAADNKNDVKDPQINFNIGFASHDLVDEKFKNREANNVFLPSVPRAKKPWCLEPLHIAWHNLIKANPELRKAVLLYHPINLIELKKYFKTIDMTFDNRDLIAFLDLHCITFRMIKPTKE